MKKLFRLLKEKNYNLIIISDANTIFIEIILKKNGLENIFNLKEDLYTNEAYFDREGCLKILPFNQVYNVNGESFDCETKICTKNICKGEVFKNLRKKMGHYSSKCDIYVGDG